VTSALIGAGIAALLAMGAVVLVRTRRHHVTPLAG
jgi:LPXTG-motif cell wall-anchored protein